MTFGQQALDVTPCLLKLTYLQFDYSDKFARELYNSFVINIALNTFSDMLENVHHALTK